MLQIIVQKLLENRRIADATEFFTPTHPKDQKPPVDVKLANLLIKKHIKAGSKIAIYGDYDVDGICATAILWETLYKTYKNVFPHIPHRESEGYGLSTKGIDHCLGQGAKLIIAVDNGIVAHKQIDYCRSKDCDIIIVDHHEPESKLPEANIIVHSTTTCAAGLAWYFSLEQEHLALVALAVICDLVPLLGLNRSFAKFGLEELNRTQRPGLLALVQAAGLKKITPYEVGFMIGPRLNAMGRLEHAIDSLRLLCTTDNNRAVQLAKVLDDTNRQRQNDTQAAVEHALQNIQITDVVVAAHESYHPGIIGLIAAKLVEKYYRPAIVISVGEQECKASARSISGFHITEHIRQFSADMINLGGHAMAAGFTLKTENLKQLTAKLSVASINAEILVKKQRIDMEIPLSTINLDLYSQLRLFEPFGLGNPTPTFESVVTNITDVKPVGQNGKHIKFKADGLEAIWFNAGEVPSSPAHIVYSIDTNAWNGQERLQLTIKGINS